MANDAYKVIADTSLPRPLRTSVTIDGFEVEEVTGQAYREGDYLYADELTARDRERAENGELDHLLEPAKAEEVEEFRQIRDTGLHIPEHEVERYALIDAGHRVIEKDQALELLAAGADSYREALEASKEGPHDANPEITEQKSFVEVPSIAQAQLDGEAVLPKDAEEVPLEEVVGAPSASASGVEMPPGLPVGPVKAKAEGADPEKVDEEVEKSAKKSARRAKPGTSSSSKSESDK